MKKWDVKFLRLWGNLVMREAGNEETSEWRERKRKEAGLFTCLLGSRKIQRSWKCSVCNKREDFWAGNVLQLLMEPRRKGGRALGDMSNYCLKIGSVPGREIGIKFWRKWALKHILTEWESAKRFRKNGSHGSLPVGSEKSQSVYSSSA